MNEKIDYIYPEGGVISCGENRCCLQLPQGYDSGRKYPFILFFHGSGGTAEHNNFTCADFDLFRKMCSDRGFIVAVPAYGSRSWFNREAEEKVLEVIESLEDSLAIDNDRFYVLGCSMGGGAALTFTGRHPGKVRAVCDVFGVTDISRFYSEGNYNEALIASYNGTPEEIPEYYAERSAVNYIEMLCRKPLVIIHGDCDSVVPKWNSDIIVEELKKHGADLTYIEVEGGTHCNSIVKGLEKKILDFFESNYK